MHLRRREYPCTSLVLPMLGRYTYEIVGGILIFISSLVGEQMPAKWKRGSYVAFGLLAMTYIWIGIRLDRDTTKQQGKLEQTITDLRTTISSNQAAQHDERTATESARQSDRDAFLGNSTVSTNRFQIFAQMFKRNLCGSN